jgi:decaprenyl-phosphate phosphoribosyltransferase
MIYNILKLMRVEQWTKNLLIFLVPISASQLETSDIYNLSRIFIGFSLIVSAGYIINDILDIESDRAHYIKRNRILAANKISIEKGKLISLTIFLCGCVILSFVNITILFSSIGYLILSILYSKYMKYTKFLDISLISVFFVYRAYLGSLGTEIYISRYLLLVILFSSLALVTGKKLSILLDKNLINSKVKDSIEKNYNSEFLKKTIQVALFLTIVTYNFWIFFSLNDLKVVFVFSNLFLVLFSVKFYNLSLFSKTEDFISSLKVNKVLFSSFIFFILLTLLGIFL